MATPRQAAAFASSSRKPSASARSQASTGWVGEEGRPQSGRKAKTKVDWGDVEAKAKSEAMWLLNWRKQQAAHAAAHPVVQQKPPRKRGRKAAPLKVADAATTAKADPCADNPRQEQGKKQEQEQGQKKGQESEQGPGQGRDGDKAVVRAVATLAVAAEEPSSVSAKLLTSAIRYASAKPTAFLGPTASAELSASAKPLTSAIPLPPGQPSAPAMPLAPRQPLASRQPFASYQPSSTSAKALSPALLSDSAKPLASADFSTPSKPVTSAAPTSPSTTDLSTLPPTDISTSPPTDLSTPASTDLSTPTPMDVSTPTPMDVSPPTLTDLSTPSATDLSTPSATDLSTPSATDPSTPASTVLSTPVGPSAPPTPLPGSPEKVQAMPPAPAPATGSALATMEVELTAPAAETTATTSSQGTRLAAPSDQGLPAERNTSAAAGQTEGLTSGEPAAAASTEATAVTVGASVVVGTLAAAASCPSVAGKSDFSRPTPVGAVAKEAGDAGTKAVSLATAEHFCERRIEHPPPPMLGNVQGVETLVVPPLAPTLPLPSEPPSIEKDGPGEAVPRSTLSLAVDSGGGTGRGGRGSVDIRVVATGTGSCPPAAAAQAERGPGDRSQGMCLLAAAAASRALEEAQVQAQRRQCGGQGQDRGLSPRPSCPPGASSTGAPSSDLSLTSTAPRGAKRPRASPKPAKYGSATGKSRKRARPRRLSGSEPLRTPLDTLARATTSDVGAAAPGKEDAMDVEDRPAKPLPWRPHELRFIVDEGGNKAGGVDAGRAPPPLPLPPALPLQLPLSAAAPAGVGGTADKVAGLQKGQEGKTPGVGAFWLQGLPKLPGFSAASSGKGDAGNAGRGQDCKEGGIPGLQTKAPGVADRAPVVLGVIDRSGSPLLKDGGLGRKSSFDSSASTARESLTSSPACSSVASAAGGEGDLGLLDAVGASSPVAVSPLDSAGTVAASGGGDAGGKVGGSGVVGAGGGGGGEGGGAEWGWGWDKGRFSLRWLPAEGLAAVQGAGASCGMDRAALDAAAAAAAAAEAAAAVDVTVAAEHAATGSLYLSHEKAQEQYNATAAASAAAVAAAIAANLEGYVGGGDGPRVVRRKAKRRTRKKRETHVLVSESEGEDGPSNATSLWAGLEEKAKAEAKALLSYRNSGMAEVEADCNQHWVRRSVRAAGASALDSAHVVKLLEQIRMNDPEVEVLKLHHYLGPDVNTAVVDAVLDALAVNSNCQALYIQNFNEGFRDEQVAALVKVLRKGNIWCLNAGENYKVSLPTWWDFVEEIKSTNVTHAYLSEHVITPELKNAMRKAIRDNRVKHTRHKQASNLEVIRRCTNMWWNPINSKDLQIELKIIDATYQGMPPIVPPPMAERFLPCSLHPQGKQEGVAPIAPTPVAERLPCSLHAQASQEAPQQPQQQEAPQQQGPPTQQQQQRQQPHLPYQLLLRPGERPATPDRTDCPDRAPCVFRQC